MKSTSLVLWMTLCSAIAVLAAGLFSGKAAHAITCTANWNPNRWCVRAHASMGTLPPGPVCIETANPQSCSFAPNTVCTGNHWELAYAGACHTSEGYTGGACISGAAATKVRIYFRSSACMFDNLATVGSCACRGPLVIDPVTGQPYFSDVDVCDCAGG